MPKKEGEASDVSKKTNFVIAIKTLCAMQKYFLALIYALFLIVLH